MYKILPPGYFFFSVVAMILLHLLIPIGMFVTGMIVLLGIVPIVLGLGLLVWAASLFKRAETAIRPFEPMTALVTEGPYRVTRNPMYLAMVLILIGFALCLGSILPFLIIPVFIWVLRRGFILREEKMLTEHFGDSYTSYQLRVRRWI